MELPRIQKLLEQIVNGFSWDHPFGWLSAEATAEILTGHEASFAMRRALATYKPGRQAFGSWAWVVVRNELKRVRAAYDIDQSSTGFKETDPRFDRARVPDTWTDPSRKRFFGFLAEDEIAALEVSDSAKQTAFQLYVEGRTPTVVAQGRLVIGKRGLRPATSVQSITRFRDEFDDALEAHWRGMHERGVVPQQTRLWRVLNAPDRPELRTLAQEIVLAGPVTTSFLADLTPQEVSSLEARFPSFRR